MAEMVDRALEELTGQIESRDSFKAGSRCPRRLPRLAIRVAPLQRGCRCRHLIRLQIRRLPSVTVRLIFEVLGRSILVIKTLNLTQFHSSISVHELQSSNSSQWDYSVQLFPTTKSMRNDS
ncbi:hypothetical protein L596_000712 [Steinernema carpocapsae]|uniref:Uncharacterized protein n=1 Tax=Steinernema carpocapsae TaxID=34508 RepID=A0A4U8UK80_STECR|nr:hypothetical protein L596_000712 [Steinernema carpocapsae]